MFNRFKLAKNIIGSFQRINIKGLSSKINFFQVRKECNHLFCFSSFKFEESARQSHRSRRSSSYLCPSRWGFLSLFWSIMSSNMSWETFYRKIQLFCVQILYFDIFAEPALFVLKALLINNGEFWRLLKWRQKCNFISLISAKVCEGKLSIFWILRLHIFKII